MGNSKRPPRRGVNLPLPTAYDQFVKETPIGQRISESDLFAHWDEIVGPTIAIHFQPVTFREGVLTVQFQNHTWAQELQWKKARLIEALNRRLDKPRVREIRFRFGRRPPPPSTGGSHIRPVANPEPGAPPMEAIESVADPQLRQAFERLAHLMRTEKSDSSR